MIEGHGDDRYRYDSIRADFSSNVPAGVDYGGLHAHLTAKLDAIARYPQPEPYTLERELARLHGLEADEVVATNGATEAIYLIAHLLGCGDREPIRTAIVEPTFAEYADACRIYRHRIETLADPYDPPAGTGSLWCCNPNNPTGRAWDCRRLLQAAESRPQTLFVIDQSYENFTRLPVVTASQAIGLPNVVIVRSMTKHFAVPGLRLGYLTARADLCRQLRELRMPWSVNALAIEAGHYLLDKGLPAPTLEELLREAERLSRAIARSGRFIPEPTDTHFMLVRMRHGSAAELKGWLARERGILIRDASNFRGLTPAHFRVAVQTPDQNDLLIQALEEWRPGC